MVERVNVEGVVERKNTVRVEGELRWRGVENVVERKKVKKVEGDL